MDYSQYFMNGRTCSEKWRLRKENNYYFHPLNIIINETHE